MHSTSESAPISWIFSLALSNVCVHSDIFCQSFSAHFSASVLPLTIFLYESCITALCHTPLTYALSPAISSCLHFNSSHYPCSSVSLPNSICFLFAWSETIIVHNDMKMQTKWNYLTVCQHVFTSTITWNIKFYHTCFQTWGAQGGMRPINCWIICGSFCLPVSVGVCGCVWSCDLLCADKPSFRLDVSQLLS